MARLSVSILPTHANKNTLTLLVKPSSDYIGDARNRITGMQLLIEFSGELNQTVCMSDELVTVWKEMDLRDVLKSAFVEVYEALDTYYENKRRLDQ